MKRIIFSALLILTNCACFAQSPSIQWQKCYGGSGTDYPLKVRNDGNGGYVAVGFTFSGNGDVTGFHGGSDFWILKLASNGDIQWQKALGGSGDERGHAIERTVDGGFVVTGCNWSTDGDVTGNHGVWDFWVVKLDSNGNIQWQKSLGGTSYDVARDIKQTFDGGYIVTGATFSNDGDVTGIHGGGDIWIVKLDSAGNIQWQKTFGGSLGEDGYSVAQTNDGYILAALTQSTDQDMIGSHGGIDTFVAKLNPLGVVQWQKVIGGSGDDRPYSIQVAKDNSNEFVFVGSSSSTNGDVVGNHGGEDYWIVRLDANGNIAWQKSIGDNGTQYARDFYQTNDGGYVLNGVTNTVNGVFLENNSNGSWIVKLDSVGNMLWHKALGGSQSDDGSCVLQTPDGGYLVGSETQSFDIPGTTFHGVQDFYFAKLDNVLSVEDFESNLLTLYPNPVKNLLNVKLNDLTPVTELHIMEMTGKLVFTQKGDSNIVNVENLASGMYIIEVYSGAKKRQNKFVKE
jgi:hypothetical protein